MLRAGQKRSIASSIRSAVYGAFNQNDPSCPHYQATVYDPRTPLSSHRPKVIREFEDAGIVISKLANGVTIVTERPGFPSNVDMGILLKVGTRDETHYTSGALLSIKNTYFKSSINTNETINYGMVQMAGGDYSMDYTREDAYFRAHCLSQDVVDIFNMMSDCALEPRSVVTANAGQAKNKETHNFEGLLSVGESFDDQVFETAFGQEGLGMPLRGLHHNIGNLNAYTLQKFQVENIRPDRIIVLGAGVHNHNEFVELVQDKFGGIPAVDGKVTERAPAKYAGGEVRSLLESSRVHVGLAFPSVSWSDNSVPAFQVLATLLHNPYTSHYQTLGLLQKNILDKKAYVDRVRPINFNFTDAGLFGVQASGSAAYGKQILSDLVAQLKELTKAIPAKDLATAKTMLKTNVGLALESQAGRLEETARNVAVYGKVIHDGYFQAIDAVTSEQINSAVASLLKEAPTLVAQGGDANRLPSYDQLRNSLKL